jgi:hypothetical protein
MGLIVMLKMANKPNICASAVFCNVVASLPQFYNWDSLQGYWLVLPI